MAYEHVRPEAAPSGTRCIECDEVGGWWMHLRRCTECGESLRGVSTPGLGRVLSNLLPGISGATSLLVLVNGLLFLLTIMVPPPPESQGAEGFQRLLSMDGRTLLRFGAGYSELTFHYGEW